MVRTVRRSAKALWGAHMTDLIKVARAHSSEVTVLLAADSSVVSASLEGLREELDDPTGPPPALIAFGARTYRLAAEHIPPPWRSRLVPVTHCSAWQFKDDIYRARVLAELEKGMA